MKHSLSLLTISALLLASCGSQKVANTKPNVILICLDTVRADHLGSYGYEQRNTTPFLDSLAAQSLQFSNASATACWTKPSVPSIFTGLLPMQHGVYRGSSRDEANSYTDVLPEEALTLAEVFQRHGYQTAAFVRNAQLRQGLGFEQGFDLYRDQAGDAREIRWQASDWLDQRQEQQPFFLYLHLLDAHWPYAVPETYASKWADPAHVERIRAGDWRALRDAINHGERELAEAELEALIALYDGSIRYMDDQLALLWSKLKREGLSETTVISVISDHGEEFMEHGRLGHGHGLYENLLQVPWILHIPGSPGRRIEARVSLLDLMPTLLHSAGIGDGLGGLQGINRLLQPEHEDPTIAEHLDPERYELSWTEDHVKTLDSVLPAITESEEQASLSALGLRGRWEAGFEPSVDGARLVTLMHPSKDEDSTLTEIELKGPVSQLKASEFQIHDIRINTSLEPEYYGHPEDPNSPGQALLEAQMVKVRGNLLNGEFVARKIKRYAPESELEFEIRGPIEVLEDDRIRIGSLELGFGAQSRVEFRSAQNDLGSEHVADLLGGELSWVERRVDRYDLLSDPGEQHPLPTNEGPLSLPATLKTLRMFLNQKAWLGEQRVVLSEEQLEDLRAIGY